MREKRGASIRTIILSWGQSDPPDRGGPVVSIMSEPPDRGGPGLASAEHCHQFPVDVQLVFSSK